MDQTAACADAPHDMSNDELASKLLCVLTAEHIRKAELCDYLCWLEESGQRERVPEAQFLCMSFDGKTHWGDTYLEAVEKAERHDVGWKQDAGL